MNERTLRRPEWVKYLTVASLGWQDSLVYRANALMWALWTVLPAITLILVWLAAYGQAGGGAEIGGYNLPQMITYYWCVTALRVAITPNHEWDIATSIREGKITGFIVRPISYFSYRVAQETSYQVIKTAMTLPVMLLGAWFLRDYLSLPPFSPGRALLFLLSIALAYALLMQVKFLVGISAFWIAEPAGFVEIWNILANVLGGGLLPLSLLPPWIRTIAAWLPFESFYAFPMSILQARATPGELMWGFAKQVLWLLVLAWMVRRGWQKGLRAYEGYGG